MAACNIIAKTSTSIQKPLFALLVDKKDNLHLLKSVKFANMLGHHMQSNHTTLHFSDTTITWLSFV